ncbi:SAM-dependent methyltransferase [Streptomyces sp. NPDC004787]|uniref:class I SAM-dependent methyltransferase n=1 Tax=Streptomyces sp. NPDC004787 TaxID=3154291 RepID=UPI0033BDDBF2
MSEKGMRVHIEPVKRTSYMTAVIRAEENRQPDRYLSDPFAPFLFSSADKAAADAALDAGGTVGSVIVRGLFGDQVLEEGEKRGCSQAVSLGAGSETRAWRLGLKSDFRFFEIDFPGQLRAKEEILTLRGMAPTCHRVAVDCDLRNRGWEEQLVSAGFDPLAPTIWIIEGLLPYLNRREADLLMRSVTGISSPRSQLVVDAPHSQFFADPQNYRFLQFMSAHGSPFIQGFDDLAGFLNSHGWNAEAFLLEDLARGACSWLPKAPSRLCPPNDRHWIARAEILSK